MFDKWKHAKSRSAHTQSPSPLVGAALAVKRRGWVPIYVPFRSKNPNREKWQQERLTEEQIPAVFSRGGNLGILTGEPSGGLTDVDFDAPEALTCAEDFLPSTGMVHGRPSNPSSHLWYIASPAPPVRPWKDVDGAVLVELRGTGGQTIIPPSVHPEGEALTWTRYGEPLQCDASILELACNRIAATAMLARHWPARGSRHNAALAVSGYLLRGGLDPELVSRLVTRAAQIAGDEEWPSRARDVEDTARKVARGEAVTGGPTLSSLLSDGEKVAEKLRVWLGLRTAAQSRQDWDLLLPFDQMYGPPLPGQVFPEPIQEFIQCQATSLRTPVDLLASLVLGAGAAACAGRCQIRLSVEWVEPLNLYIVAVLLSGELKSPAFRATTAPLEEREQELARSARIEIAEARTKADILSSQLQEAKSQAARAKDDGQREKRIGEASELARQLATLSIPVTPRLIADDATSEAVASLLAEQQGVMAIMSTEGGLFETLGGRYSQGIINIDVYLKGYSGDPLRIDRKGRPPEYVPKPTLTLALTVQPDVIRDLAAKPGFRGRGLLARFLFSIPKSMVGYRSNDAPPVPVAVRQGYQRAIRDLLKLPFPAEGQEQTISLSPDAHQMFQAYRDQVEMQLRPGAELYDNQDWGNKLCGTVARLAGILHLLHHAGGSRPWEIPLSSGVMDSAIRLGDYFAAHAEVAFAMMGVDPRIEDARHVWATIEHRQVDQISLRDLQQRVKRRFSVEALKEVIGVLVEMGYLRPAPDRPTRGPGRPPSPVYEVNPLARPHNPHNSAPEGNCEDSGDANATLSNDLDTDVGEV